MVDRPSFRLLLLGAAAQLCAQPQDPTVLWFSVPAPGTDAPGASAGGWLGQGDPADALLGAVTGGAPSLTRLGMDLASQGRRWDGVHWNRKRTSLWMDGVLEVVPGLAFGLEMIDMQPKSSVQLDSLRFGVVDPQGGLRVGAAGDIFRPYGGSRDWSLGWSGWIPLYNDNAGWTLQTGLVHARRFRLDLAWTRNDPATPGWIERSALDSLGADTAVWRTRRSLESARLGWAFDEGTVLQGWIGRRELEDPGPGERSSWGLAGDAWSGGLQLAWSGGPWTTDGEVRGEVGETVAHWRPGAAGWSAATEPGSTSCDHRLVDGRMEVRRRLARPGFSASVAGRLAWLDLDASGRSPAPFPSASGRGESRLFETTAGLRATYRSLSVEPRLGLLRQDLTGDPPLFWWPFRETDAERWAIPWSVEARLSTDGWSGRALYRISGEVPLDAAAGYESGYTHRIEIGQDF